VGKIKAIKTNFNAGELTKQAYGRVDLEVYQNANKQMINCLPTIYGSATKRGGTKFITDNIKRGFIEKIQKITGNSQVINGVTIDHMHNKYLFACNNRTIIRCDFDFTNIQIVQLSATTHITYGAVTDFIDILVISYAQNWHKYVVMTNAGSYKFSPTIENDTEDWSSVNWDSSSSSEDAIDYIMGKTWDYVQNYNPKLVYNGATLWTIGVTIYGLKVGTYQIANESKANYNIFRVGNDDNYAVLANGGDGYILKTSNYNFNLISFDFGKILGAKKIDSNYAIYGYKQENDKYNVYQVVVNVSGNIIDTKKLFTLNTDYNLHSFASFDDRDLFLGENGSVSYMDNNDFEIQLKLKQNNESIDNLKLCKNIINNNNFIICNGNTSKEIYLIDKETTNSNHKGILIPFKINKNINYVLEFGDHYIRFYKNRQPVTDSGGAVYEIPSPYSISDLIDDNGKTILSWTQNIDVLYMCHKDYPIQVLKRYGDTNWVLEEFNIKGGVFDNLNSDTNKNLTCTQHEGLVDIYAKNGSQYLSMSNNFIEIQAVYNDSSSWGGNRTIWQLAGNTIYSSWSFLSIEQAVNALLSTADGANFNITYSGNTINVTVKNGNYAGQTLRLIRYEKQSYYGNHIYYCKYYDSSATFVASSTSVDVFTSDDVGKLIRLNYTDANTVMWEVGKSVSQNNIRKSGNNYYIATSSGTTGQIKPIHTSGSVSDGGVTWKYLHSGYGIGTILEVVDASHIKVNVDGYMPDFTNGTYLWELGLIGKDGIYPNCCAFFKERFVFAISTKSGTKICASCAGDYNNFSDNSFGEVLAENAITVVLQGKTESEVLWMIPGTKLYIGTNSEEFIFGEQTVAEVLSPTNVSCSAVSALGSAKIKPLEILDEMLFVSKDEKEIANFTYVAEKDSFRPVAISVLFEHLLHNGVKCWDWTSNPHKAIWFVDKTGNLRTIVYNNDQKVIGASRHFVGEIESLCVIPEPNGNYDDVWILIKRSINGQTQRYIEYFTWGLPQQAAPEADEYENIHGVFCDSAKVFEFENEVSEVTGLYWLENETVDVIVDGKVQTQKTVTDGTIQLDKPGKAIVVGLDFGEMLIETLLFNLGGDMGTSQGSIQRVNKLMVRVIDTCQLKAKATFGNRFDTVVDKDTLQNGDFEICLPSDYSKSMTITLKNDKPVNCCVCALIAEFGTYH